MTLFSLSIKNLKKSMKNYMIYFFTLILGVAIFYVFSSVSSQKILIQVLEHQALIIDVIDEALSAVGIFVAVVLGFLIVYASSFLMKRRKKEFGVYMLLGMSKRKISLIIVMETLLIGLISLIIGLGVGIIASQGMSVIIANMFEADMTNFEFVISGKAIVKTFLYFCIMYGIVILLDVFIVGKAKLINLLTASKKAEKNTTKNPYICLVVFIISMYLLVTAYYNVTAGIDDIQTATELVREIVKGIIGNFGFFWSVAGFFTMLAKANKRFYYRKLNSFTTNELGSRINTTVFSASIICLMLFFTICIMSCSFALKSMIDEGLRKNTPCDVEICVSTKDKDMSWREITDSYGVDLSKLNILQEITFYNNDDDSFFEAEEEYSYVHNSCYCIMNQSEYNKICEVTKNKKVDLNDNEYAIICNYRFAMKGMNYELANKPQIEIAGKKLDAGYDKCITGFKDISETASNFGFVVVADNVKLDELFGNKKSIIYGDYNTKDKQIINEVEASFEEEHWSNDSDNSSYVYISTKKSIYDSAVSLTLMVVFVGLYIGSIFMISGAAILALKLLSEAVDNKEKYDILRKIGTDNSMINRSIFTQCAIYFGLPMTMAIIHSIFGIQTGIYILASLGRVGLTYPIIVTAVLIGLIYGGYAVLTFLGSARIINEK